MIPHYEKKFEYISRRQGGNCAIAEHYGAVARITELHHRLHDTKPNRWRFPLFIDSVFNLAGVNHDWHMKHPYYGNMNLLTAEAYEGILRDDENLRRMACEMKGIR